MSDANISLLVLLGVVALFITNRVPIVIVAIGAGVTLFGAGVLSAEQVVAGFGDPVVVFIATLFIVGEALDRAGVMSWAGQQLVSISGGKPNKVLLVVMLMVAALTAVLSINGAVAALLPMVVLVGWRVSHPAILLMPLAFAAHAASMLTLTGSPVNVLVAESVSDAGGHRFGYAEFALAGLPLLAGSIVIMLLLAPRVLPKRELGRELPNLSNHGELLRDTYEVDPADLAAGEAGMNKEIGLAEVMVPPRSVHTGEEVYPGMSTRERDVIAVAMRQHRNSDDSGRGTLVAGDTILLQGPWQSLERYLATTDLLTVNDPTDLRRQAVPLGLGAKRAITVAVGMVILLATGAVPAVIAGLLAAGAMILLSVLTIEDAYGAIRWTTVLLVGGMFALSTAISQSGAAETLADALIYVVGDAGPYALLAGLFVLTATLGQLISNMATALVVLPVAFVAAADMNVPVEPVAMCVAIAAAAALLTPVATPVNLMVQEPAGYRFGDYSRLGLPLLIWFFAIAVFWVPVVWKF